MKIKWFPAVATATLTTFAIACGGSPAAYPIQAGSSAGAEVYAARCASCHGDASTPPPLAGAPTHTVQGHTWHHPDRLLVEWILDGVPLATVMPQFRGVITEEEAIAAVAHIKTFWPQQIREQQLEASRQYEVQLAGIDFAP